MLQKLAIVLSRHGDVETRFEMAALFRALARELDDANNDITIH